MDTSWLEDFLAVIREGGFSRAAERRSISQSAFSRRIKSLEDWAGCELFSRETHSIELTAAGERLKPFAEDILRLTEAGRADALAAALAATETLLFASTHALALTFFPRWLRELETRDPQLARIQLTADSMANCERLMSEGRAQFLLCHAHPAAATSLGGRQFRSIRLGEDSLIPVAAPSLAQDQLFSDGPYLAFSASSGMGRILAAAWEETGGRKLPEPSFSSHLATALVARARDGGGFVWAPMSLIGEDLAAGRLVEIGDSSDRVPISICLMRPRARQTAVAERFWSRLQSEAG